MEAIGKQSPGLRPRAHHSIDFGLAKCFLSSMFERCWQRQLFGGRGGLARGRRYLDLLPENELLTQLQPVADFHVVEFGWGYFAPISVIIFPPFVMKSFQEDQHFHQVLPCRLQGDEVVDKFGKSMLDLRKCAGSF